MAMDDNAGRSTVLDVCTDLANSERKKDGKKGQRQRGYETGKRRVASFGEGCVNTRANAKPRTCVTASEENLLLSLFPS